MGCRGKKRIPKSFSQWIFWNMLIHSSKANIKGESNELALTDSGLYLCKEQELKIIVEEVWPKVVLYNI